MRANREADKAPGIMMEPMIDAVFLLLIFFLVSATIQKQHSELPIELPDITQAEIKKDPDDALIISIMPSPERGFHYRLTTVGATQTSAGGSREDVTLNQLITDLRQAAFEKPGRKVRIDADNAVPMHVVSQIMDHCKLYQLRDIGLRMRDPMR
ncbi:MAG: biopolymer transporter ExbD [Planctomycetota bacterium]|nr:MAG: biopolymer transporter ExbD [Planctomycetota bacterium]